MAVFAKVVECGSFKRAAENLALSPSVVSHHISQLEDRVGKSLLHRTTRNISLTADGIVFYDAANDVLRAAVSAFDAVSSETQSIGGELRVLLPSILSRANFLRAITGLETKFPRATLSLSFSDNEIDNADHKFDVALAFGNPKSSDLSKRKIIDVEQVLVASKLYLGDNAPPETVQDLKQSNWIWPHRSKTVLSYRTAERDGKGQRISISPRAFVDNSMACRRLALEGIGLALIPRFAVEEDLQNERLIQITPKFLFGNVSLYAAWPTASTKTALTQVFIDFMAESFN